MKNLLLKRAVQCTRPFISKHKTANQILIVSTTALGDTLWATPAIENIRKSFPHAYIGVLTSPIGLQALKHNPHIDQLFLLQEPLTRHFYSLWRTLYQERFDTILLFHASQRLTLPLCSLLGATRIIGTAGINKGLDTLLTNPLPNHAQHEIVRRLKIAEQIGAQTSIQTLSFFLKPDELLPPRSPGPWIALHPGSKDAFKRWPTQSFIQLGKRLKETLPCELLITGTKEERPLMEEIASQIPGAHIDEPNRPLRQFAALLTQMDLLISNDTGPVHLACALNRPVIGIYSSTDPALCGPHKAPHATAISRRAACDPCLKRKCRQPFCFLQIGPEEVLQAATSLLRDLQTISKPF
ncbi:MAG: glycosyltransferase family 9 protein [Verrucomicrobiota bacterium]|nr:glycosyltransferase family 9 protein [Verrucomicrobiota bacterium]